jgi:hypothetical protein
MRFHETPSGIIAPYAFLEYRGGSQGTRCPEPRYRFFGRSYKAARGSSWRLP